MLVVSRSLSYVTTHPPDGQKKREHDNINPWYECSSCVNLTVVVYTYTMVVVVCRHLGRVRMSTRPEPRDVL